MKEIKKILFFTIFALANFVVPKLIMAQQDPLYTQYMDNLLVINPAYAGSKENGNILLVARNQWVSLPNSPITRSLAYQTPTENKNVGLGFSVMYDKIGPQKQTGAYFDYSYFLRVSEDYKLGMGLKGGVSFYRVSLTDLITIDPDPIYSQDIYKNFLPNIGVGFFLFSDNTYFGLSIPKLIENTITRDDYVTEYVNRQKIHLYSVAGKKFNLNQDFQFKTNAMLRFVKNSPISFQLTALAGFQNKFWVGGMVRLGDSFAIMTQFQATQKMLIGHSYDFITSQLDTFSSGTHEIMFSYDLNLFK